MTLSEFDFKYPLPKNPADLIRRAQAISPKNRVIYKKLISLSKIYYSNNPQMTAAVSKSKLNNKIALIFGRDFCSKNLLDDRDLTFLLWHELLHLVFNHFSGRVEQIFKDKGLLNVNEKNIYKHHFIHIILDAQINASAYKLLGPEISKFPSSFYHKSTLPQCILRHDAEIEDETVREAHKKLYSKTGISDAELIDALRQTFEDMSEETLEQAKKYLLGGGTLEEADGSGQAGAIIEQELLEGLLEDIEAMEGEQTGENGNKDDKEEKESKSKQAGKSSSRAKKAVEVITTRVKNIKDLTAKIGTHYKKTANHVLANEIMELDNRFGRRTVIPNIRDNATRVLMQSKKTPIFHNNPRPKITRPIAIYLDVSGSQDHVIPKSIGAIKYLQSKLGKVVYCFSNYVSETLVTDLIRGEFSSSGGTCFNCVAEHILENKFDKAIILTDGYADLDLNNIEQLKKKRCKINVGWTDYYVSKHTLEPVLAKEFYLFPESSC